MLGVAPKLWHSTSVVHWNPFQNRNGPNRYLGTIYDQNSSKILYQQMANLMIKI